MDNNLNQLSQIVKGADIGGTVIKELGKTIIQCRHDVEKFTSMLKAGMKEMAQLGDNLKTTVSYCVNVKDAICQLRVRI